MTTISRHVASITKGQTGKAPVCAQPQTTQISGSSSTVASQGRISNLTKPTNFVVGSVLSSSQSFGNCPPVGDAANRSAWDYDGLESPSDFGIALSFGVRRGQPFKTNGLSVFASFGHEKARAGRVGNER